MIAYAILKTTAWLFARLFLRFMRAARLSKPENMRQLCAAFRRLLRKPCHC